MRYTKQIIFLLFLNLIIVLLSIFIGNYTRQLELVNNKLKQSIENETEQLTVNSLEYSLHSSPIYLKKLHSLYFSYEEDFPKNKIISLKAISDINNEALILANIKTK